MAAAISVANEGVVSQESAMPAWILLVGGVGFARGIGALNMGVVGNIFMSWIITLPAGAILSIFFFYFFKGIFG
jgi:PiT family inorganic phosphate transporter